MEIEIKKKYIEMELLRHVYTYGKTKDHLGIIDQANIYIIGYRLPSLLIYNKNWNGQMTFKIWYSKNDRVPHFMIISSSVSPGNLIFAFESEIRKISLLILLKIKNFL